MSEEPSDEIIEAVRKWLGPKGIRLFRRYLRWTGTVGPVFGMKKNRPYPHPVHWREGMYVRNFLRGTGLCKNWTDHDYDNRWMIIVQRAVESSEAKAPK